MKMRVLVVDDEFIARKGMTKIIEEADPDWKVIGQAPDGMTALSIMEKEIPDVVITDIRMSTMDGIRFSKVARSKWPDMLIVVASGYSEFTYAQEAVKFGALDYLLKPTSPKELVRVLRHAETILAARNDIQVEKMIRQDQASGGKAVNAQEEPVISNPLIQDAVTYMRRHFDRDLTTREMAEILHLNVNYFCDLFKKETGLTFLKYLSMLRITAAKLILAQKINVKTSEVAYMVGYTDSRYFTRIFKNATGMTPGEYKEYCRNHADGT